MLLRYSLALEKEAAAVERAVEAVLNEGYRTYDIMSAGRRKVGTREMGDVIAGKVK
jgi:3-isopropylmalate dehydrogenase